MALIELGEFGDVISAEVVIGEEKILARLLVHKPRGGCILGPPFSSHACIFLQSNGNEMQSAMH